ncbi:hypothetical protein ILUMI_27124 [Ignelater luminosus]|uniref:Uncharacterized protein n=1 Tax=Ignelater luminosus TaxID=2038154 RepID=A0A8K0FVR3_IGNLU|nr:hypothetical protein ILUMI_27124 [Ignelater luminosus]
MNKELEMNAPIKAAYTKGNKEERKVIIVEMEKWEDKRKIMERIHKLRGQKVFIESELTDNEKKIQFRLREIVRSENEKGGRVKVGYKKVIINGKLYTWKKGEEGFLKDNANENNLKN